MNKVALWIVVLVALGLLAFVFWGGREGENVDMDAENQEEVEVIGDTDDVSSEEGVSEEIDEVAMRERLESANISIPDLEAEATLEEGEATFDTGDIVPTQGLAILGDNFTVLDIDGQRYVLAHISFNTGGTGVFDYLVSFRDTGSELEQVDSVLLGDQIVVESVESENTATGATITVDVLVRAEGESLAVTPSVEDTVELTISAEGELEAA